MNKKTQITITPHPDSGLKSSTIYIAQEYIDKERRDILEKACKRLIQEFIAANEWEVYKNAKREYEQNEQKIQSLVQRL